CTWTRTSLLVGLLALPVGASASEWVVRVDEQNGLPTLTHGGGPAFVPSFDFWGANWGWTGFYPTLKVDGPYRYTL
ncbi:hypothetical protein QM325_25595, partial [Pseudomonas putida]|nr:hypothetical protein [Pseudomonas putida]